MKERSREDQLLYHNFRKIKIDELIRNNCGCTITAEMCEKTCGFIMAGSDTPESDGDTTLNDINIQLEDNKGLLYYQQNSINAANNLEKYILKLSCMTTEQLFDWNIYACHPLLIRDIESIKQTNLLEYQKLKDKKYILYFYKFIISKFYYFIDYLIINNDVKYILLLLHYYIK